MKKSNFKSANTKIKKALVIGGIATAGFFIGKHLVNNKFEDYEQDQVKTYSLYREKIKPITPFLIADLIAKEGVRVDKNGMHKPYKCSKGIPTIGFGSTMLKDGTRVTMKTKPITTDEAYELARWHLEDGESYFVLYCYDTAYDEININEENEALGMGSIIFNSYSKLIEEPEDKNHKNRFESLRKFYNEYGFAVADSIVLACFDKYPVVAPRSFGQAWLDGEPIEKVADKLGEFLLGGDGLCWRRWLEAGLLIGEITPQMLLECPADGMFEFFEFKKRKRSAFFTGEAGKRKVNRETFKEFKKWLKNPVDKNGISIAHWKKVKDWLPADVLYICENGQCKLGDVKFAEKTPKQAKVEIETYVFGYDELYSLAIASHKAGDYKEAAKQFENLIKDHPDNALLRNDLADTYNKLGQYDKAIVQAREIVRRIGDKSQYGAANYNAGFAYEKKGKLQDALANYKLAVANGNRKVQVDVTRVANNMKLTVQRIEKKNR